MPASPRPVDVHVGRRLRERRTLLGMSQERLAELLGVTYQQVQKYERGSNRIGSSRLHDIARYLDVPVAWFFAGLEEPESRLPGLAENAAGFTFDAPPAAQRVPRETAELVRAFTAIREPEVRRRLVDLVRTLAALSRRDSKTGPT